MERGPGAPFYLAAFWRDRVGFLTFLFLHDGPGHPVFRNGSERNKGWATRLNPFFRVYITVLSLGGY
jgi:hypothetical protein